jgi:hypothetical protein
MHGLTLQGADTVADLRELPPGTYTFTKLADSLGLPLIKAHRLLTALKGTRALSAKRSEASLCPRFPSARTPPCSLGAHQLPPQPDPEVPNPRPPDSRFGRESGREFPIPDRPGIGNRAVSSLPQHPFEPLLRLQVQRPKIRSWQLVPFL